MIAVFGLSFQPTAIHGTVGELFGEREPAGWVTDPIDAFKAAVIRYH